MSKISCLCGICRKCRQRKCMQRIRDERREEIENLKREERENEIRQSLHDHGAISPMSTLNPYVSHSAPHVVMTTNFRRGFNYGFK